MTYVQVELNDAVVEEPKLKYLKCLGDDVASVVLLQPKERFLPTSICIANAQFGEETHANVHIVQVGK